MKVTTHELKLSCYFADAIWEGRKNFELRRNDRGYQTGDRIRFRVVNRSATTEEEMYPEHPICGVEYEITYILSGWGLNNDMVALGIRPVEKQPEEQKTD